METKALVAVRRADHIAVMTAEEAALELVGDVAARIARGEAAAFDGEVILSPYVQAMLVSEDEPPSPPYRTVLSLFGSGARVARSYP